MFVLYASNPISSQHRYENKDVEDGKGSQGQTDSHEHAHCVIEKIEDWQTNRREERGDGHRYSELGTYVYHTRDIVEVVNTGVNQSGKEPPIWLESLFLHYTAS